MRGDIHIHSKYSPDSNLEPDQIVRIAKSKGLDFVAISDHNRFIKHEGEILILQAEEVSSTDGHVLALFINGEIPSMHSQEETVEMIHDRNGIAICAHPFRRVNGVRDKFMNIYDAIEVKNGRCSANCNSRGSELATRFGKPETGGSDAHFYDEVGRVYLDIDATDEESIRNGIVSGNSTAGGSDLSLTNQVRLYFKLGKDYSSRGFKRI